MTRPIFGILLAISLVSLPATAEAKAIEEHIYLLQAGKVDKKIVDDIRKGLPLCLPMSARIELDAKEDALKAGFDPTRNQYDARSVLDDISSRITIDKSNECLLVVTDGDLYIPGSDFVFGDYDAKKGICIISIARLKDGQIIKEAACFLGHCLGVEECANPRCVASLSKDTAQIDKKKEVFCRDCRKALRARYDKPLIKMPF